MSKKGYFIMGLVALGGLILGWSGRTLANGRAEQTAVEYAVNPQLVLPTSFSYQGSLQESGTPAAGNYDFMVELYDADTGGNMVSSDTVDDVTVANGLFTIQLDFGANAFVGSARWLAIGVRPGSETGSYTFLTPRQAISAAPYALSLRPGATIEENFEGALLNLRNSNNTVGNSAALFAANSSPSVPTIYSEHVGSGNAVYGISSGTDATLQGTNDGSGTGVYGMSTGGYGVQGRTVNSSSYGVVGLHPGYEVSDLGFGAMVGGGVFGGQIGVTGFSKGNGGYGVWGYNTGANGWAGYFGSTANGINVSSNAGFVGLSVTGGTKNAVVGTEEGARLMYTEEATEVWFTDYGFGQTSNGRVIITIDPTYAEVANFDEPYHVFLQPYGEAELYVTNRTSTQFEVVVLDGKDVEFSYRIVAKRMGYETDRLERAPWADEDPHLFPAE